ncbi:coiled-coil domain-containing protein 81-like [Nothobranchius furzeri]|uniref:coiled-coil domain-containing protein 81-like n=1 Tax=Nothobranchius furzeri TaxID=105023 RepID=UPI003904AC3E
MVVQLNFAAVSCQTPFSRNIVESCVRETLGVLYKALASEKNVFKNNKVQMKFNRDFLMAASGTSKPSESRAGGSVSSLSGALSKLQRPETASPVALPTVCSSQPENKAGSKGGGGLLPNTNRRRAGGERASAQSLTRHDGYLKQFLPHKKTGGLDKKHRPQIGYPTEPGQIQSDPADESRKGGAEFNATYGGHKQSGLIPGPNISISSHGALPKLDHHLVNVSCSENPEQVKVMICCVYSSRDIKSLTANLHEMVAKELCYLRTQRAQRDIPEYRREQQQVEEKAQEKLLLLREQQRDRQGMKQELAKLMEQREHAKQVAAFNLQMSEKRKKDFCSNILGAFVFQTRPLTPPRKIQQLSYMNELRNHVEIRQRHEAHDHQSQRLLEHHKQVQLLQELASHRAQHLQQKQQKPKHYKKALGMQAGDRNFTKHFFHNFYILHQRREMMPNRDIVFVYKLASYLSPRIINNMLITVIFES